MTALQIHWLDERATADESELRSQIGGKASSLIRIRQHGMSVPHGFVLPTGVCRYYFEHNRDLPPEFWREIGTAAERLRDNCTKDGKNPSVDFRVAVRSGAAVSMPGTMQTVLGCPVSSSDACQSRAAAAWSFAAGSRLARPTGPRASPRASRCWTS